MSNALVFLDESGDLGWKFDLSYRQGGSSRHFTIAAAIGENGLHTKFGKIYRQLHRQYKWSKKEKKWTNLTKNQREQFAKLTRSLINDTPGLTILSTTIEKQKIPQNVRDSGFHFVYAWMVSSLLTPELRSLGAASICPDEMNNGVGSEGLLEHFLRKEIYFTLRARTTINRVIPNKALEDGLKFADFLAGAVQSHFEDGDSVAFNILYPVMYHHTPWA